MEATLAVGLQHQSTFVVDEGMCPPHLPMKVLSTPSMIQQIEGACLMLAQPHLGPQETTVGTHVCVSHVAPAMLDEPVTVACELTGIEKRRLTFTISVTASRGTLSEGTHERAIISLAPR